MCFKIDIFLKRISHLYSFSITQKKRMEKKVELFNGKFSICLGIVRTVRPGVENTRSKLISEIQTMSKFCLLSFKRDCMHNFKLCM